MALKPKGKVNPSPQSKRTESMYHLSKISRYESYNKATGDELFNYGAEELIRRMHKFLCRIWSNERMPVDRNLNALYPIQKNVGSAC